MRLMKFLFKDLFTAANEVEFSDVLDSMSNVRRFLLKKCLRSAIVRQKHWSALLDNGICILRVITWETGPDLRVEQHLQRIGPPPCTFRPGARQTYETLADMVDFMRERKAN
jgi:hypothetical protein